MGGQGCASGPKVIVPQTCLVLAWEVTRRTSVGGLPKSVTPNDLTTPGTGGPEEHAISAVHSKRCWLSGLNEPTSTGDVEQPSARVIVARQKYFTDIQRPFDGPPALGARAGRLSELY